MMHRASRGAVGLLAALGCVGEPGRVPAEPPPRARRVEEWAGADPAGDVEVVGAPVVAAAPAMRATPHLEPAAGPDALSDSDEPVVARRYVYRVRLAIPEVLGAARELTIPANELVIDTSPDRLRARFVGVGWPVEAGTEVRLRGDSPGAYIIGADGGHALEPGQLALYFEGGPRRPGPPVSVRPDRSPIHGPGLGALVCALIAEWGGEPRDNHARRCDGRAPVAFRVGLWRAERTADLPITVPRRELRADHVDAPAFPAASPARAFFAASSLSQIAPRSYPDAEHEPAAEAPPDEGLVFVNASPTRVIATIEGIPVGTVAPGAELHLEGLRPGSYGVGALRPLGSIALRPRIVDVPARTVLRAPRRRLEESP